MIAVSRFALCCLPSLTLYPHPPYSLLSFLSSGWRMSERRNGECPNRIMGVELDARTPGEQAKRQNGYLRTLLRFTLTDEAENANSIFPLSPLCPFGQVVGQTDTPFIFGLKARA